MQPKYYHHTECPQLQATSIHFTPSYHIPRFITSVSLVTSVHEVLTVFLCTSNLDHFNLSQYLAKKYKTH